MKNLLALEIAKIRHYTMFWIIIAIYVVIVPLLFFGLGAMDIPFFPPDSEVYGFPTVWNYITWIAGLLNLLLGVLIVNLTCNEYTYRTQRQHVIDGMTRREVLLAKILFYSFLAAAVTLYTFLIGSIAGFIYTDNGHLLDDIHYIGLYFVQTLGYFSFAYFFAALVKRPALSIVLYILIFIFRFIFTIIMGVDLAQFMPINVMADLIEFPFFKQMFKHGNQPDLPYNMPQYIRAVVAFAWMSFFMITTYQIERRRDL